MVMRLCRPARTKRLRLAPAATVLPLHHPIRVAEQWATLDLLSGGRVDFAAGRGYDRREYRPLNASRSSIIRKYSKKGWRWSAAYGRPTGRSRITTGEEEAARARQIRYYKECVIAAFPGDPKTAPPSYRYFIAMVDRLRNVRPADLTENSVLLGSPAQITDTLKKVEAAGFDEVILYFNVGLKPHPQVKDEMARFMAEVAPAFA